jgi:uncharacterized protein
LTEVFADTGFWIGLTLPTDPLHELAVKAEAEYSSILTSEWVLVEFLNTFSRYSVRHRKSAAVSVANLRRRRDIEIVPPSNRLFDTALTMYETYSDKRWSFTDCASFCIMKERSIVYALAHDHHFVQAGFTALLKED